MTVAEARRRLLEFVLNGGIVNGLAVEPMKHEDDRLFDLARDYVDAKRRELDDALREMLDEVRRRGE